MRRISYGEGVERIFPVHSPRVDKVEVERKGSVRRAKLTYLRKRIGKGATLVKGEGKPRGRSAGATSGEGISGKAGGKREQRSRGASGLNGQGGRRAFGRCFAEPDRFSPRAWRGLRFRMRHSGVRPSSLAVKRAFNSWARLNCLSGLAAASE